MTSLNIMTISKARHTSELLEFLYSEALDSFLTHRHLSDERHDGGNTPALLSDIDELMSQDAGSRMKTGSFYTNKRLVRFILSQVDIVNKKVIDPAGGTGNFIIDIIQSLWESLQWKSKDEMMSYVLRYIDFNEIKDHSFRVCIDRINAFSFFAFGEKLSDTDLESLSAHFSQEDFLTDFKGREGQYDLIVGNPPYLGTKSLGEGYLSLLRNAFGFSDDLYSLFTHKAIDLLTDSGKLCFITSSTFMTIRTKEQLRKKMIDNGLHHIRLNSPDNFSIKTATCTFFIDKEIKPDTIEITQEADNQNISLINIKISDIISPYRLPTSQSSDTFFQSEKIYQDNAQHLGNAKKLIAFSLTKAYQDIIENNDVVPLGMIAYIATGVDFKGNNDTALYSLTNVKHNEITDPSIIKESPSISDIQNGLNDSGKLLIPAIKGNEMLYVRWDKEYFDYLKSIKAPLRNLSLYDINDSIYCKTSSYDMRIVKGNTLCINTAGACFIKPIMEGITCENILAQLTTPEYKAHLKSNINNSLCLTPNDMKLLPVRIR